MYSDRENPLGRLRVCGKVKYILIQLHCKNRLVVLTTEWLPWLHVLVW